MSNKNRPGYKLKIGKHMFKGEKGTAREKLSFGMMR